MIVTYLVANDAECDWQRIRRIINSGQTIFSLSRPTSVNLRRLPGPLALNALEAFVERNLPPDPNADPIVLITSREIQAWQSASFGALSVMNTDRVIVISNYRSTLAGKLADLAFVRRILHAIMRRSLKGTIGDSHCVCGSGSTFIYLSKEAEHQLRKQGYRDGIRDLFQFINWLNQVKNNPKQLALRQPPTPRLPLVEHYAKKIAKEEGLPFENKVVLMVLHFLSDLVPFVKNVIRLGAKPSDIYIVAKPYPYPARDKICHVLEMLGIQFRRATEIYSVRQAASEILTLIDRQARFFSNKRIIVIEDGGYFAPLMHLAANRKLLKRCVGIVEQTTKGIWTSQREVGERNIAVPILSVAQSSFKDRYESPEIGRATVQNISRFVSNMKLSGRRALVLGFGSIGIHVAESLNRSFNMGVSVVDTDPEKLLLANHRKDIVTEAKSSFAELAHRSEIRLVAGTTGGGRSGRPSVTTRLMKAFPDKTILVSTSSDRVEFDVKGLTKLANGREKTIEEGNTKYTISVNGRTKSLFLLAEGYPINFYSSDSVPNETIDPIMALLLLCSIAICQQPQKFPPGINVNAVNEITGPQGRDVAKEYSAITARN